MFKQPVPPGQPRHARSIAEQANDSSNFITDQYSTPGPVAKDQDDSTRLKGGPSGLTAADHTPFKNLR